jgi:hypothetical protein
MLPAFCFLVNVKRGEAKEMGLSDREEKRLRELPVITLNRNLYEMTEPLRAYLIRDIYPRARYGVGFFVQLRYFSSDREVLCPISRERLRDLYPALYKRVNKEVGLCAV